MIRKLFWVCLAVLGYFYIISNEKEGAILLKTKQLCNKCYDSFKKMDIQVEINKSN